MKRHNRTLFAIISIFILAVSPAAAMVSSGGAFKADAAPGEHLSHNLKISPSPGETTPLNLTVDVLDWYQDPNALNVGVKENPDIEPYSARKFLSVSPKNFSISPGTSQQIEIEGKMPSGNGGRYAMIFVHTVPTRAKGSQGVAISYGIYTQVLLTISGSKLIKNGEIEDLSLVEPISRKQQNITAIFRNTGNYHYKINASALLEDERGNILATASPVIRQSIIPTAEREIDFSIIPKISLKPGTYTVEAKFMLDDGTVLATGNTTFQLTS
jgi:P pilus assembly chaperone PapD